MARYGQKFKDAVVARLLPPETLLHESANGARNRDGVGDVSLS
jgi:hypothetical protein